jgi:hypothetical protein
MKIVPQSASVRPMIYTHADQAIRQTVNPPDALARAFALAMAKDIAHCVGALVKLGLHRLEYRLMFPTADAAIATGRAQGRSGQFGQADDQYFWITMPFSTELKRCRACSPTGH